MKGRLSLTVKCGSPAFFVLQLYVALFLVGTHIFNPIMQVLFVLIFAMTVLYLLRHPFRLDGYVLYMGMFIAFAFLSTLWAKDMSRAMESNMTFLRCSLLGFCIYILCNTRERITRILLCFQLGIVFLDIYCVSVLGIGGLLRLGSQGLRLGLESGTELNSNFIGSTNAIGAIMGLCCAAEKKKKKYLSFLLIDAVFVLLSSSRGALITMAFGFALFVLFGNQKSKYIRIPIYILLAVIGVLAAYNLGMLSVLLDRFAVALKSIGVFLGGDRTSSSSNIRMRLIYEGLLLFVKRPFLGYGSGQFGILVANSLGMIYAPHNAYIQSMVSYGIMGLILWQGMYIHILKKLAPNKKDSLAMMLIVIICMWLLHDMFGHSLSEKTSYYLIAVGFSLAKVLRVQRTETREKCG